MSDNCILCGGDTEQDGLWPVELADGTIVAGGCLECFEKQSDASWWDMVSPPRSRFRQWTDTWVEMVYKVLGVPQRIINSARHGSFAEYAAKENSRRDAETQGKDLEL